MKLFNILFLASAVLCSGVALFLSDHFITNGKISLLFTTAHKVSAGDIRIFFIYLSLLLIVIWHKMPYCNKITTCKKWFKIIELDIVRGWAAITIILFHWQPYGNYFPTDTFFKNLNINKGILDLLNNIIIFVFQFGYLAVGVFIILSGLSLSMNYHSNISMDRAIYWKSFYIKRCIRILPLYWLVLILSFWFAYYFGKNVTFKGFVASFFLVQNYYFPWYRELGVANQPLWFIPLLVGLYILFPILLWLRRVIGDSWFLALLMGFSVVYSNAFVWILPIGRVGEFGLGIVLGYHLLDNSGGKLRPLIGLPQSILITFLFWILVFFASQGLRDGLIQPILPILLFLFFWNLSFFFSKSNTLAKLFSLFAGVSYAAYLIHPLGMRLLPSSFVVLRNNIFMGLLFTMVIFALSFVMLFIEKPLAARLKLFFKLG